MWLDLLTGLSCSASRDSRRCFGWGACVCAVVGISLNDEGLAEATKGADDCGLTLIELPEGDIRLFLLEAITAPMRPIVASRRTRPVSSALLSSPPPWFRALTKDLQKVKPTDRPVFSTVRRTLHV